MCAACPIGRGEEVIAELHDLLTAEYGEFADMGFTFRQAQLYLEPAVCLLFCHQPAFPHALESGMGINALAAQRAICQGAHGQIRVPVGGHIGIAGGVVGTDIVGGGGVDCLFPKENGGRAEMGLAAAVGALDVDSFH